MPKSTFYHLPQQRQNEIMEVALKEFSKRSLHEASVGNITKELGLSRASFYKYFDNLEELYVYLYHQIAKDPHELLIESLKESEGDLFDGMKMYAHKIASSLFDPRYHSFYRTMMLKMDYGTITKLEHSQQVDTEPVNKQPEDSFMTQLTRVMNVDNLTLKENELRPFLEFLTEITHELFKKAFLFQWSQEEAEAAFYIRVQWLEKGLRK